VTSIGLGPGQLQAQPTYIYTYIRFYGQSDVDALTRRDLASPSLHFLRLSGSQLCPVILGLLTHSVSVTHARTHLTKTISYSTPVAFLAQLRPPTSSRKEVRLVLSLALASPVSGHGACLNFARMLFCLSISIVQLAYYRTHVCCLCLCLSVKFYSISVHGHGHGRTHVCHRHRHRHRHRQCLSGRLAGPYVLDSETTPTSTPKPARESSPVQ
jgi:hypothetical protein